MKLMTNKELTKLDKSEKMVIGDMITEMLQVMVDDFDKDLVITQKLLIEQFCKMYKKLTVEQVNYFLVNSKSIFRKTKCFIIYGNKVCGPQYTNVLEGRILSKVKQQKNTLKELHNYYN